MKTIAIEQLAEKLGGNLWVKGDLKRIYLDRGHNTKKMSTKTYVYEKDARFIVVCNIDCPSQDVNWISSQEEQVKNHVSENIAEIIEECGFEVEDPKIAIEEALAAEEQVQGYFMKWEEVRVVINRFGKIATRKRQLVQVYRGAISKKPNGFIELNDEDFAIACSIKTAYEYGQEPNLIGEAQRRADYKAEREKQAAIDEEKRIATKEKEETEKQLALSENKAKIERLKNEGRLTNLLEWKLAGAIHPAPIEVMEAKMASGLNWNKFTASIIE